MIGTIIASSGKKGQLKIQQMAFMLIAVTLFFVLVGMLFLVLKVSDLRDTAQELDEKNAMLLASKIASSPEFSCGESFGTKDSACVDADKVMMLKQNIDSYNLGKTTFWGDGVNVEIRKFYPALSEECTLSTYPDCGVINLFGESLSTEYSTFVLLCYKEADEDSYYDKCELAKLMVGYDDA